MRAVVVEVPGDELPAIAIADIEKPAPGMGEVPVKVHYAGCNCCEVQSRQGGFPMPTRYPAVPRAGEKVLIHATSGAVSLYPAKIAKQAGASVYGTTGSKRKTDLPLSLGADRVTAHDTEDFVGVIMAEAGRTGIDPIVDSLGADTPPRSLINIGEAAGEPDVPMTTTLYKRSRNRPHWHAREGREIDPLTLLASVPGRFAPDRLTAPLPSMQIALDVPPR